MPQPPNSRYALSRYFTSEAVCREYLEQVRWCDKVVSPYDSSATVYNFGNGKYRCAKTKKFFNVLTGTILQGTKLPLSKWFEVAWIMLCQKKGLSSVDMARAIGVQQKTAWRMMTLIREISEAENNWILSGVVELDETFVGGKNKNRHWDKKVKNSQGRSYKDKVPVQGMLERGGKVVCRVVNNTSPRALTPNVRKFVSKDAKVYTDEWSGYKIVWKEYNCEKVEHGKKQYVKGDAHTNTIEGFWSILKRGLIGIYHRVSKKYLQHYVNEFVYRYNTRKQSDGECFLGFMGHLLCGQSLTDCRIFSSSSILPLL